MNPNRPTLTYIIIKMAKLKYKERIIKANKGKESYKRILVRLSADFSAETLRPKKSSMIHSKCWREKKQQPRIIYTARGCLHSFACMQSLQLCLNICDYMDSSPPAGSSVLGILQARILEWVTISYSRGFFPAQELNPSHLHLLNWWAGSLPLGPPWWKCKWWSHYGKY